MYLIQMAGLIKLSKYSQCVDLIIWMMVFPIDVLHNDVLKLDAVNKKTASFRGILCLGFLKSNERALDARNLHVVCIPVRHAAKRHSHLVSSQKLPITKNSLTTLKPSWKKN